MVVNNSKRDQKSSQANEPKAKHLDIALTPLDCESSIDVVGTVGGVRIYIPARMAKNQGFPFRPGKAVTVQVVIDENKGKRLLITERAPKGH